MIQTSLQVRVPGRPEPIEMLVTDSPENLARDFADGANNKFGKAPFTKAGAVVGPLPNRFVGPVKDGKVTVTLPNSSTVEVPANHEGSTVPRYHLHGFYHRLKQQIVTLLNSKTGRGIGIVSSVDVKGRSEEWQWPSDSELTVARQLTHDNKLKLTIVQTNTGKETTYASWVERWISLSTISISRNSFRGRVTRGRPSRIRCRIICHCGFN